MKHPILELAELSDDYYQVSGLDLPDFSALRIWCWDLEATGLDTTRERVTQIAGIPLVGGRIEEHGAFSQLVHPGEGIEIPPVVQELTGLTLDKLAGAPSFPEAWAAHLRAAASADLWIGQSVFEFDVPLLEAEFARHGMPKELPAILDSVVIATALLGPPEGRWSTSALIDRFAVDIGNLRRHDALDDVKILGKILIPLLARIESEHDDRLRIPADGPIKIRRHPPIRTENALP